MIIEPISGNGGNIIPPHAYFTALRKLCDEYGIVLIFDEIQTGIGRTGKMFAYEHFGVNPNIITTAKGLGGIGFPVAAILAEERFAGLQTFHHSFTYGANSLAAAAACKTLDIISDPKFLENIRTNGAYILSRLQKMREKFRFIGDVRGLGLMIGVEIVDTEGNPDVELTNRFIHLAQRKHVLIRSSRYGFGNVFKIRPALTITAAECEMLCDKIEVLLGELA
jgi:4-aminobutyrate aminotransferase